MSLSPIRVLSTLGVLGVVRGLLPAAEAAGFRPEIRFDPTARLVAAIEAGERGDIAILTAEGIAAQAAAGVLDGASRVKPSVSRKTSSETSGSIAGSARDGSRCTSPSSGTRPSPTSRPRCRAPCAATCAR